MYFILDKDMIEESIVTHLPRPTRGFCPTVPMVEIVNAILYKLKAGVHWRLLPVRALFSDRALSWHRSITITESGAFRELGGTVGYSSLTCTRATLTFQVSTLTEAIPRPSGAVNRSSIKGERSVGPPMPSTSPTGRDCHCPCPSPWRATITTFTI